MTQTIDFKAVAEALRTAAKAALAKETKYYSDDPDMIEMLGGDYADVLAIATFIEFGETDKANVAIMDMDTVARDDVGVALAKISADYYDTYLIPAGWVPRAQLFKFK